MTKPSVNDMASALSSGGLSAQSSLAGTSVARPIFRGLPKSSRPLFLHSRLLSKDTGNLPSKARLVEQFYNVDSAQILRSHGDLAAVFRSSVEPNALPSGPAPNIFDEETLSDAFYNGQLIYNTLEAEVPNLSEVVESLMNIEWIISNDSNSRMQSIEQAIELVSRSARELERSLAHRKIDMTNTSTYQLARLSTYLKELQLSVSKVQHDLANTTLHLKAQYREEMNASMNKLETLEQTLYMLSTRLDRAKKSMSTSKELLTDTMQQKLKTLEYISARFADYDQVNQQRRVRQLIVALVVLVVVVICEITIMSHTKSH